MAFDVQAARRAGYSDAEIADYLGDERGFKVSDARRAGYTDAELVDHLNKLPPPKGFLERAKDTVGDLVDGVMGSNNAVSGAVRAATRQAEPERKPQSFNRPNLGPAPQRGSVSNVLGSLGIEPVAGQKSAAEQTTENLGLDTDLKVLATNPNAAARREAANKKTSDALRKELPKYQSVGNALVGGANDLGMLSSSAIEAVGEVTGIDGLAAAGKFGREKFAGNNERNEADDGNRGRFLDIRTVGDALGWAGQTAGNLVPVMVPAAAGSFVGGSAAGALGVSSTIGSMVGAFVPSLAMGVGEVQSNMKQKDPNSEADGWVFAGGTAIAALDSVLPGKIGGSLIEKFGREAAEEVALRALLRPATATSIGQIAKAAGREAGKDALIEGLTESVQEAIGEVSAAKAANQNPDWAGLPEQMLEAGAAGAFMGGGVGGVTGAIEGQADARASREASQGYQSGVELDAITRLDPNGYDPLLNAGFGLDELGRLRMRRSGDTRTPGPGMREQAILEASNLTTEDADSPLGNEDIVGGRTEIAKATASNGVDAALTQAGLPKLGARVAVANLPGGNAMSGTIEDVFSDDTGTGVVVRPEGGGRPMREYLDTLNELGVSITAFDPLAEANSIDATLASLSSAPAGEPPLAPADVETPSLRPSGRTPSTGAGGGVKFDMNRYMARIRQVESGGKDNAKAGTSSATGRYQFTDGTWLNTYKAVFGNTGENEAQILAKRADGAVQDRLMQKLTSDNAAALQATGLPVNDTTLYLAHFAGIGGARSILKVAPERSVETVLGKKAVAANSFLKGKTAGDLINWAAGKVGGEGVGGMASTVPDVPTQWAELPESAPIRSSEAPAPDLPVQPVDDDTTGLKAMGSGIAGSIGENLRKTLLAKVEAGDVIENGQVSPILQAAKLVKDAGVVVDVPMLERIQQGINEARASGNFQTGMRAMVSSIVSQNTAGPQDGGVAPTVEAPKAGGPEATANDSAGSAAGAVTTPEPLSNPQQLPASTGGDSALSPTPPPTETARVEETSTGTSVAVIGTSEEEMAAISAAVPDAKAMRRKDGAMVYGAKYAKQIRAAIAGVSNPVTSTPAPEAEPAEQIAPAPQADDDARRRKMGAKAKPATEPTANATLDVSRAQIARQIEQERTSGIYSEPPPSQTTLDRLNEVAKADAVAGQLLPVTADAKAYREQTVKKYFGEDRAIEAEMLARQVAVADGSTEVTRRHMAEAASYIASSAIQESNAEADQSEIDTEAANTAAQVDTPADPVVSEAPAVDVPAETVDAQPADTPTRIDDFGEQLVGARKDVWQSYKDRLSDAAEIDVTAEPLSKTWPEPDYQKLLDAGADPYVVAWVHAARDEIPTKPQKGWKLKGWADDVRLLRDMANKLLNGDMDAGTVKERMLSPAFRNSLRDLQGRVDLYMEVGHEKSLKGITLASHFYSLYRGEKNVSKWSVEKKAKATAFGNWPREIAVGDTREEAVAKFKALYAAGGLEKKADAIVRFDIYSRRSEPGFIIGKKVGKDYVDLKRFDTAKEARDFKVSDAGYAELVAALDGFKDIPAERKASNAPRIGIDHRSGADVTPEAFAEAFGFRGVQFGNYVEGERRQSDLNEAYDALMDLAGVIGVPARALSLNGELGLAFGARGKGGKGAAAAHFEPDTIVINLTKNKGAGSLAHEWWHSLDNYFSRMRASGGYMTEGKIASTEGVRPEMVQAFKAVVSAIKQTGLQQRSKNLDKRRTKDYWSTDIEMSARAFESFVIAKLQDEQFSNDYLANIVGEAAFAIEDGYPYLRAAEIPAVRAAFDEFFKTVEVKETERGVALYSVPDVEPIIPVAKIAGKTWQERRMAALQWYNRNLVGTTVTTAEGMRVQFTKRSGDKTTTQKGDRLLAAVPAIGQILERGSVVSRAAGTKPGMQEVLWISAPVQLADGVTDIAVMVRRQNNGTYQYSITDREFAPAQTESDGAQSVPTMEGSGAMGLNLFDGVPSGKSVSSADTAQLESNLQERLESYGIGRKVAVRIVDTLNGAAGEYQNALMKIATDTTQAETFTLDHEVIHALRELGLFNTSEWAILSAKARRDPGLMRSIRQRYEAGFRKRGMSGAALEEALIEEAVSDMFGRYQRGDYKAEGTIARVFKALRQAIEAIANYVQQRGARTAEGVMQDVAAGQVGARNGEGIFDGSENADGTAKQSIPEQDDPEAKNAIPTPLGRVQDFASDEQRVSAVRTMLSGIGQGDGSRLQDTMDAWRVRLQDKMLPVLRLQDRISQALGRDIAEAENAYLSEELMTGRVGARLERLSEEIVEPLIGAMNDGNVSLDELETYLYARHAQERNARIAAINPEFSEGEGSGMTDLEAAAVMSRVNKSGKKAEIEALASLVDRMLADALQTRIEAGLISKEEAAAWAETYKHYVPLRGRIEVEGDVDPARARVQAGLTVKGKESKRAFGRRSKADNILSYAILQAEEAIIRAEKNAAAQAFLKMAQANPNDDFWKVNKIERRPVFNDASGLVRYENQSRISADDAPFTVTAKVDGVEHHITMERTNPEAVRVATAMRNLDDPKFNKFMAAASTFNRYFSAINTRYNPSFVVTNMLRDVETAMVTLGASDVPGLRRGVLKDYVKAMTASSDPQSEWGRWRREWEMAGGKVYFNQAGDLRTIRKDIELRMKMKANPSNLAKIWSRTFDAIEAANESVERAVRLSVYKNAREAGLSAAKAASLSRNVTTNFTRKGQWGPALNAFFAFFNASMQGSTTFVRAVARSKKARRAVYGVVAAAFLAELLNSMMSGTDDDGESYWDKLPEFEKEKNLIIMIPGGENGEAIKIPLAYGLNAFANIGRNAAAVMRGGKSIGEAALNSATATLDAFNPMGSGSMLNMIAPTVLDPLVDTLVTNENFAGKPIHPNQSPFEPDHTPSSTYSNNTSAVSKAIAKAVNKATGGDDVLPGTFSLYPEDIEYFYGFATGGSGRFVHDLVKIVTSVGDPEADLTIRDVPIVKSVITEKAPWVDKERFYQRVQKFKAFEAHAKAYVDREDMEGLDHLVQNNLPLARMEEVTKAADKVTSKARKSRREVLFAIEMEKVTSAAARPILKEIEADEAFAISKYNEIWNATMVANDTADEE